MVATLGLEALSFVILGLWRLGSPGFTVMWHGTAASDLQRRFLTETMSLGVTSAAGRLEVSYLVEPGEPADRPDFNEQSMQRIRLLRGLFPDATEYAAKGLGLDSLPFSLPFDPTQKSIPRSNLPVPFAVRLNAVFHALVNYRYLRAAGWPDVIAHYEQGRHHQAVAAALAALQKPASWSG